MTGRGPDPERAPITITIKSVSGLEFILENIDPRDDVSVLQKTIQLATGWPIGGHIRVMLKGRLMVPGNIIEHYGVNDNTLIHYVQCL